MIETYVNETDGLVEPIDGVKIMHLISDMPESPTNEQLYNFALKAIEVAKND